jgi:glutaredoxin
VQGPSLCACGDSRVQTGKRPQTGQSTVLFSADWTVYGTFSVDWTIYGASTMSASKPLVTIYSRPGCHLCDEAKESIRDAGCDGEFILEEINIDEDDKLAELYGNDIPVVFINRVKVFKHRVDPREFKRKLRRSRQ